ncbi:MAG: hypothetical protein FWD26_01535 [Treponema sp.]|nr:hypothetical protein [Treponema sp.]
MKNYKSLAQTIYIRKSHRKFSRTPAEILEKDIDLIKAFDIQPLDGSIRVKVKILRKEEVINKRSDYCIAFYSEEKPHYLENIGFIGQQLDLELQSKGLGTCWWGMKKPKKEYKREDGLNCIITMTAGMPYNEQIRSYPDGFIRKAAKEIIIGESNSLTEAARIAPSAINLQPWLIENTGNKYNFYLRHPKSLLEKMIKDIRPIDMGIAIAHLFIQAKAEGSNASFIYEGKNIPQGKYTGSIIISPA